MRLGKPSITSSNEVEERSAGELLRRCLDALGARLPTPSRLVWLAVGAALVVVFPRAGR